MFENQSRIFMSLWLFFPNGEISPNLVTLDQSFSVVARHFTSPTKKLVLGQTQKNVPTKRLQWHKKVCASSFQKSRHSEKNVLVNSLLHKAFFLECKKLPGFDLTTLFFEIRRPQCKFGSKVRFRQIQLLSQTTLSSHQCRVTRPKICDPKPGRVWTHDRTVLRQSYNTLLYAVTWKPASNIKVMVAKRFLRVFFPPWRRGMVGIASASSTEDPGFESRQGVRFLGLYTLQCCCENLICIVIVCIWENKCFKKFFESVFSGGDNVGSHGWVVRSNAVK
jgi:hypothetical protein